MIRLSKIYFLLLCVKVGAVEISIFFYHFHDTPRGVIPNITSGYAQGWALFHSVGPERVNFNFLATKVLLLLVQYVAYNGSPDNFERMRLLCDFAICLT